MSHNGLLNKNVILYLDGGWSLEGIVTFVSNEVLVLRDAEESSIIAYKNKIVAAKIIEVEHLIEKKKVEEITEPIIFESYVDDSDFGVFIPEDMLDSSEEFKPVVDFSIQMSSLKNVEQKVREQDVTGKKDSAVRKRNI